VAIVAALAALGLSPSRPIVIQAGLLLASLALGLGWVRPSRRRPGAARRCWARGLGVGFVLALAVGLPG
jgi:hypothetical protein